MEFDDRFDTENPAQHGPFLVVDSLVVRDPVCYVVKNRKKNTHHLHVSDAFMSLPIQKATSAIPNNLPEVSEWTITVDETALPQSLGQTFKVTVQGPAGEALTMVCPWTVWVECLMAHSPHKLETDL